MPSLLPGPVTGGQVEMREGEILVVSQGRELADSLGLHLAAEGWSVRQSRQFAPHLDPSSEGLPALVVLDLQPPMSGGLNNCRELLATCSLPLIALLPWPDPNLTTAVLDLGADDCLAGPISPRELVLRIRAVLRRTGRR